MTDFKKILCIICIALCGLPLSGQPSLKNLPLKKLAKMAEGALNMHDVYAAIDIYQNYVDRDTSNIDVLYKLANLYRVTRYYEKAAFYYEMCYNKSPNTHITSLFYNALMLKQQGNYTEALAKLDDFRKKYKGRDFAKRLDNEIAGCRMALNPNIKPLNVEIQHLDSSINKIHIEFSPMLLDKNTLIYASLPADTLPYYVPDASNVLVPKRKFYLATRTTDVHWKREGLLPGPFNTDDSHNGNGVISQDGKRLYFSRCTMDWQNNVKCAIHVSYKNDSGIWSTPKKLPFPVNTEETSSTMPALGWDNKKKVEVLFFVSNRTARSEGGLDIWYSIFDTKDSAFNKVDNVGRKINTPGDEITPFYDNSSRTLYFSSDFHPGYGGFDIFKIKGDHKRWTKVENFGYPINTGADESYLIINTGKKEEGFFASNRTGSYAAHNPNCCDDLYTFINKDYIRLGAKGFVYYAPKKELAEDTYKQPAEDVIVTLFLLTSDEEGEALIPITSDTTDDSGNYFFDIEKDENYRIMISKDGYFYRQLDLNTMDKKRSEVIQMSPVGLEEITLDPVIFYIYYDFDKADLTPEAKLIIDTTMYKILTETPDIIVEISSHTDSYGDSAYNEALSQRRAESVVNYLISKGIEQGRLIAKGYGENKPIADNDSPEGRAKNRRTEFKVVGSKDPYSKLNISKLRIISKPKPQASDKKEEAEDLRETESAPTNTNPEAKQPKTETVIPVKK